MRGTRGRRDLHGWGRGARVAEASTERGLPQRITVDNGTDFTSRVLDHCAYWQHVALEFSRPGKPVDNTFIEAFNGTLRRECLSLHWFLNLEDLQQTLESWRTTTITIVRTAV